jgi:hypothetical protein
LSFYTHGNPAVSFEIRGFPSLPHGSFGLVINCNDCAVYIEHIITENAPPVHFDGVLN